MGPSAADFQMIVALRRDGHPFRMPQARLMTTLALTSGTLSVRVDRLVRAGIVSRDQDPADGRASLVTLTAKGHDLFDKVAPAPGPVPLSLLRGENPQQVRIQLTLS